MYMFQRNKKYAGICGLNTHTVSVYICLLLLVLCKGLMIEFLEDGISVNIYGYNRINAPAYSAFKPLEPYKVGCSNADGV